MKVKISKKYTTRFKKLAFGGDADDEVLAVETIFDENGHVLEETRIDDHDQVEKHIFTYNQQGKLVVHTLLIEADGITERFEFTRDEKQRITKESKWYGDDEGERTVYEYAEHDQPVLIERYDADNEPEAVERIIYNEKNMLVEHQLFDTENKIKEITKITYDDRELPVEKISTDTSGKVLTTTQLVYNDQKEVTRATERNSEGKITSDIISIYDEKGNVTERKIRDFHSRTLRFTYDDRNNCTEEMVYDEHGNLTMKSDYEFDENNNVVRESGYFLDMNRGSQVSNSLSRYEYEFFETPVSST